MGVLTAVAKFFSGLVTAFNAWLRRKERKADVRAGRHEQELENRDKVDSAEEALDSIKPPTKDEVVDDLKDGKF